MRSGKISRMVAGVLAGAVFAASSPAFCAPAAGGVAGAAAANHAPVFTSTPPTEAVAGAVFTYDITTADPDPRDAPAVSVIAKPAWLSFVRYRGGAARLRGTPSLAKVGTWTVRLRVTDVHGARTTQRFALTVVKPLAAEPVLAPGAGVYDDPVEVTLTAPTPGSSIRYTLDGSAPTALLGTLYASPVHLAGPTTLRAVAFGPGLRESAPASAEYAFTPGVATLSVAMLGMDAGTIRGTVNPRGQETRAWFEWGIDPLLEFADATPETLIAAGGTPVAQAFSLTGLASGTTYYYRMVAENAAGLARGPIEYFSPEPLDLAAIVVNAADDPLFWQPGKMTIRAAIERLAPGGTISFDPALDGRRIDLSIVGEPNTGLVGEVFQMVGGRWEFLGFQDRNYGKSALFARKSLIVDASALPGGITLAWAGGDASRARVLAVYGNLLLRNVTITGGFSEAEAIPGGYQPFTLARGGGVAVWGVAAFENCTIAGNRAAGDLTASRDRGAFGGGVYADWLFVRDSVISGNAVSGFGAAGGGLYSVGGSDYSADPEWDEPGMDSAWGSQLLRSTVSGNRVTAQHAYGGGVYSDGGGPGNLMTLRVEDCTIARNLVEDHPGIAQSAMMQYYYRGGGIYMSNGYLWIHASTIAENEVTGFPTRFKGKPNLGGGGIAATIGDAHVVEDITLWHSIIVGNRADGAASDVYTGSLLHLYSDGYNLVGTIDFSQMLVPIPEWMCLSRRHWPKVGDESGVVVTDVLDIPNARLDDTLVSAGVDAGEPALLWYPPLAGGPAVNRIPQGDYEVVYVYAGYYPYGTDEFFPDLEDDFLNRVIDKLRGSAWLDDPAFGLQFGDLTGTPFIAEGGTWPSLPVNAPWIAFWRALDIEIGERLGPVRLGDEFWGTFASGPIDALRELTVQHFSGGPTWLNLFDQLGADRSGEAWLDVGAIDTLAP